MDAHSAPGPDGFTGLFFKSCWDFMGVDVVRAVQFMFNSGTFPAGINSTFMVLLPKSDSTDTIEQYRLIVLGNFIIKVVTKVVADRLSGIVSRIVTPNQFSFVQGKEIDSFIAGASGCVNLMNRCGMGGSMAFKVDIRKTFDTLSWDFLIFVYRHLASRLGFVLGSELNWLRLESLC